MDRCCYAYTDAYDNETFTCDAPTEDGLYGRSVWVPLCEEHRWEPFPWGEVS